MHFPDGVLRTPLRSVTVGIRFQIRLENWLDHQLGGGLHHSIPDSRNSERPFPAPGLWDHHPPDRLWFIRLVAQLLSDTSQPLLQPFPLDIFEALSIYSRRALIGSSQFISMGQNVLSVYLVVEQVKAVPRFVLRLAVQLDLKVPNLTRRCQTHRQSPFLPSFTSTPEARALPSAGITRLHRSYGPLRLPGWPPPFLTTSGTRSPPVPSLPQLPGSPSLHAVLTTPVDRTGACWFL